MKKLSSVFLMALLVLTPLTLAKPAKADAGLTLGIIGTALGGTSLALGAWNAYQLRKQQRLQGSYAGLPLAGGGACQGNCQMGGGGGGPNYGQLLTPNARGYGAMQQYGYYAPPSAITNPYAAPMPVGNSYQAPMYPPMGAGGGGAPIIHHHYHYYN